MSERRVAKYTGYQLHTKQAYKGDVGYDLSALSLTKLVADGNWVEIPTGVHIAPPAGFWMEICGRSSNIPLGIEVARGIIDAGYRGPLFITARCASRRTVFIQPGERIAQVIFHPIINVDWEHVPSINGLGSTERGTNAVGSTGK